MSAFNLKSFTQGSFNNGSDESKSIVGFQPQQGHFKTTHFYWQTLQKMSTKIRKTHVHTWHQNCHRCWQFWWPLPCSVLTAVHVINSHLQLCFVCSLVIPQLTMLFCSNPSQQDIFWRFGYIQHHDSYNQNHSHIYVVHDNQRISRIAVFFPFRS